MTQQLDTFGLMFLRQTDGTFATCEHSDEFLSFAHNGMSITNPCLDESATELVDPQCYGFFEVSTGAGAALRLDQGGGEYFQLTDSEGLSLPCESSSESTRFCRYNAAGQLQAYCYIGDIP